MILQWYPGHMTKARRQMQEDLKLIDLIIELVDARIPLSSRNPDIDELGKNKSRLILLNKSDLADEKYNEQWTTYFQKKGFFDNKVVEEYVTELNEIITKDTKLIKAFKYFIKDKEILNDLQSRASRIIQENKVEGKL